MSRRSGAGSASRRVKHSRSNACRSRQRERTHDLAQADFTRAPLFSREVVAQSEFDMRRRSGRDHRADSTRSHATGAAERQALAGGPGPVPALARKALAATMVQCAVRRVVGERLVSVGVSHARKPRSLGAPRRPMRIELTFRHST